MTPSTIPVPPALVHRPDDDEPRYPVAFEVIASAQARRAGVGSRQNGATTEGQ